MNLAMLLVATLISQAPGDDALVVSPGARLAAKVSFDGESDAIEIGRSTVLQLEPFTWVYYGAYLDEIRSSSIDTVHPRQPSRGTQQEGGQNPGTFAYVKSNYGSAPGDVFTVIEAHDAMEVDGAKTYAIELLDAAGFTYWLIPRPLGQTFVSRSDVLSKFRVFPPAKVRSETKQQRGGY